ncbi:hypothetical protein BDR26DRAFT_1016016 [Obelidium mucronatum]|nr:hypothetical protein BDR26DRAFT_1016016 [Obelidium mucronatum]
MRTTPLFLTYSMARVMRFNYKSTATAVAAATTATATIAPTAAASAAATGAAVPIGASTVPTIAANRTAIIATVATTVATSPADAAAAAASTAATAATVRKRSWWTKHWCSLNQSFARNWCDARYTSPDSCAAALTPQPLPALEDGWLNQGVIFSTHLMGTSPVFDTFSLSTVIENMSPEWKPRFKRIALGTDLHTTVFKVCSKSYSDSKDNIAKKLFGKYGKGARMTAKQNLPLKRFAEHLFSNSSLAKLNRSALLRKIRHLEQF